MEPEKTFKELIAELEPKQEFTGWLIDGVPAQYCFE